MAGRRRKARPGSNGDRPIRVGVIGIGFGQQVHVPAFSRHPACEVVAVCATRYERARAVADRLRVPKAYGSWRELVGDPDVDVVSVATPPTVQPAAALAALAQGKPVFCEKPLAATREQAAEMLEAARRSGLPHMVDFEFVAIDEWIRAKAMLDDGALGRLRHASVTWHVETYAHREKLRSWKTAGAALGGGVLNSTVSHTFHYLEWLLGPVRRLAARLLTPVALPGPAGESVAVLWLEFATGLGVSVSVSTCALLGSGHRLEIYGEEGSLILDNPTSDYVSGFRLLHGTRKSNGLTRIRDAAWRRGEGDGRVAVVGRLVDRFVDWLRTGSPAKPSFEHGYRVQCLLDWARQAHNAETWVDVSTARPADPGAGPATSTSAPWST